MNKVISEIEVGNKRVRLVSGDITSESVDAIVNAANSMLMHGGGVAGAIVRKGGQVIQEESRAVAPVPVGEAVVTGAGSLPCRFVIHAVGPRNGEGDEDRKLRNAVLNSLRRAQEKNLKSVSMPAISSGIFGFPKDRCARILVENAVQYLRDNPESSLEEVRFCIYDSETMRHFKKEFEGR